MHPHSLFSGMHIGWLLSAGFHGISQSEISHACQLWQFCTPLCILANYPEERHFPTVTWPYSHCLHSVSWRSGEIRSDWLYCTHFQWASQNPLAGVEAAGNVSPFLLRASCTGNPESAGQDNGYLVLSGQFLSTTWKSQSHRMRIIEW